MFENAAAFNQNIGAWDVTQVTDLKDMFKGAVKFDYDLSTWILPASATTTSMFEGADAFNTKFACSTANKPSTCSPK